MAGPTIRDHTGTTGATATEPSGTVQGDGLIYIGVSRALAACAVPSGWTSVSAGNGWAIGKLQRGASAPSYAGSGATTCYVISLVAGTYSLASVVGAGGSGTSSTVTAPSSALLLSAVEASGSISTQPSRYTVLDTPRGSFPASQDADGTGSGNQTASWSATGSQTANALVAIGPPASGDNNLALLGVT